MFTKFTFLGQTMKVSLKAFQADSSFQVIVEKCKKLIVIQASESIYKLHLQVDGSQFNVIKSECCYLVLLIASGSDASICHRSLHKPLSHLKREEYE